MKSSFLSRKIMRDFSQDLQKQLGSIYRGITSSNSREISSRFKKIVPRKHSCKQYSPSVSDKESVESRKEFSLPIIELGETSNSPRLQYTRYKMKKNSMIIFEGKRLGRILENDTSSFDMTDSISESNQRIQKMVISPILFQENG